MRSSGDSRILVGMWVAKLRESGWLAVCLLILVLFSLGLGWVSSGFSSFDGWVSFLVMLLLMGTLIWLIWYSIQGEDPPRLLLKLVVMAAVLRLALGVFWFLALPAWGYENEVQQAGYVMRDAFERDADAWELAQSDRALNEAFQGSAYDQYGGLLYLSALAYRYLGADVHHPLLIVVVTAVFSALAVIYSWAFARQQWGEKVAGLAAWFMVFYPEAMLLGSAQMREAFLVTLAIACIYFLHRLWHSRKWHYLAVIGGIMLLSAAISFPFTGWILFMVVLLSVVMGKEAFGSWKSSWDVAIVILLFLTAVVFYWTNQNWVSKVGYFQAYLTQVSSGHIQKIFREIPEFLHAPFLIGYGVIRPLLPAALIANNGELLWQIIAIWRSLGWTSLLLLLIYASFLSLKSKNWQKEPGALLFASWLFTFIASYRGGGDDWDNPRYRVAIAGIQVTLVAWALGIKKEENDPWLRRFVGVASVMVFWVLLWYLPRYFSVPWSVGKPLDAVGLGIISGTLYLLWEWVRGEVK